LPPQTAGILSDGSYIDIEAGPEALRLIVIAGKPLGEPVVQYGPFVMNTRAEIDQALDDYRQGRLTA
jgi:redox-sensitive bicupin YhaK (pirin superfamily)